MGGGCVARRPSLSGNSDRLQGVGVKSSEPDGPETLPPQNHAKERLKQKVLTKIPRSGHTRILCNSSLTETVRYTERLPEGHRSRTDFSRCSENQGT